MIIGCKGWNDRSGYFRQDNNEVEEFLRAYGVKQYYATCFPTSVCRAISATRDERNLWCKTSAGAEIQPETAVTMIMNNPNNRHIFAAIRNDPDVIDMPENQVPQYMPAAFKMAFDEEVIFDWADAQAIKNLIVSRIHAVVPIKKPGHAVCFVAYDNMTDEFIYDDPLYGFNLRIRFDKLETSLKYWNGVTPIVYARGSYEN